MTKKKKRRKKGKVLLCFFLPILLLLSVIGALVAKDLLPSADAGEALDFSVADGAGTIMIASDLKEAGIIKHEKAFLIYAETGGYDQRWQRGAFELKKGMGYHEICETLTAEGIHGEKVTIPEGKQLKQIAGILEEHGICSADAFLSAAAEHHFDEPFLKGIDHENPLEGYLFPNTYDFEKNSDPDVVIEAMLKSFEENVWREEYIDDAKARGLSFDDLIILASVVESEATTKADRETVAGVFLNRLNDPSYGKLQSCVTVEYAMGVKKSIISYEDTQFESPYNTYLYPGLPVGPICCPGIESIEAVLYHDDNDYYYFQSDREGKLYFAKTFAEHAAIQKQVQAHWQGEVIEDYNK